MAPIALADVIASLPTDDSWGPPTTSETLVNGVPYAPYSKGDKLGRMADWTAEGKDKDGRGGRQQYNRNYRDQAVYGAGTSSIFAVQTAEDESSFSVVDNTRASAKTRGFGRGGGTIFRGRGRGDRGGQRGQRGGAPQRGGPAGGGGGRGGNQQGGGQYYDGRGGRGRGGRRFGWKDYDKPQRNREFSVAIKPDWAMLEEIDFARLQKLHFAEAGAGEDLAACGFLYYYDRGYDRQPVKKTERRLNVVDRLAYNVSASSDPVIQELAERDAAAAYATDGVLAALMCAPRSVYSWDLVLTRTPGGAVFLDKRDGSAVDLLSVNENAVDAPLEAAEGNKDAINLPAALADEAVTVNHLFAWQTVVESQGARVEYPRPNPFHDPDGPEARETPLASKAYKYRRFDLSSSAAAGAAEGERPLTIVVRTELDAAVKNNISGEDQFMTIKALNEFDSKVQGGGAAGGGGGGAAADWRAKLLTQPGAVVATEMKNNSCKLARWTTQSILAKADVIKLGFVSRVNPKDPHKHAILGAVGYDPRKFAEQMNLSLPNGWAIVRAVVDMVRAKPAGKYVLVKDPNKPVLRLYAVPPGTFEDDADEGGAGAGAEGAEGSGAGGEEEGEAAE